MIISALKEPVSEQRVALVPRDVKELIKLDCQHIWIEQGAGNLAFYNDADYSIGKASIKSESEIIASSDLMIRIHPFSDRQVEAMKEGQVIIGQCDPLRNIDYLMKLAGQKVTCFSLDMMPRITRAQSMDVLSSMATIAGYKAALMAAVHLPNFFPMFMTAAGTIKPSRVLVLGAGVAGLQAISTARRLGAIVEAFDVRAAAKEDVISVGAKFIEVEGATDDAAAGGYAVEQTEAYRKKQADLIHQHAINSNVVICTAQIPGRKAPLLIRRETVEQMKPGSVIIDLAASSGGNCEVSEDDQVISRNGVTIIGNSNLAATTSNDASQMYSKNVTNFLKLLIKNGQLDLDFEDELVVGTCVVHQGEIVHPRVIEVMNAQTTI